MRAKNIYKSIMKAIHYKEDQLQSNESLEVYLAGTPGEVIEIGYVNDDFLFFTTIGAQDTRHTLLLPPTSPVLELRVLPQSSLECQKRRNTIGFLANVSTSR